MIAFSSDPYQASQPWLRMSLALFAADTSDGFRSKWPGQSPAGAIVVTTNRSPPIDWTIVLMSVVEATSLVFPDGRAQLETATAMSSASVRNRLVIAVFLD